MVCYRLGFRSRHKAWPWGPGCLSETGPCGGDGTTRQLRKSSQARCSPQGGEPQERASQPPRQAFKPLPPSATKCVLPLGTGLRQGRSGAQARLLPTHHLLLGREAFPKTTGAAPGRVHTKVKVPRDPFLIPFLFPNMATKQVGSFPSMFLQYK